MPPHPAPRFGVSPPALSLLLALCVGPVLAQAQPDVQQAWQLALLELDDGDTLHLPAGTYTLSESLVVDGYADVVIMGAGMGETILQYAGQTDGAEGLRVANCERATLRDFTVLNTAGDAIKTLGCAGITFANVETSWTGEPRETNGSYGLYPVQCTDVLIENCTARGASDAGIYVGQSDRVVVRGCTARENVAGIEIENTTNAEVYGNLAEGNTGGILVFDLPGLIQKAGGHVVVRDNRILRNNLKNFAPAGNIVARIPAGTGVMVLATSDVQVRDNEITNHRTSSVVVSSYHMTELPIQDSLYAPIPTDVVVTGNAITRKRQWPDMSSRTGKLLALKFRRKVPPILYDGITAEALAGETTPADGYGLCVGDNGGADWADLDAARDFDGLARNPAYLTCAPGADDPRPSPAVSTNKR